jgi:hypothetical protein
MCKCGQESRTGQSYCLDCHAAYMRAHRPKHKDLSEISRRKANTRSYTNVLIKRGKIEKQPCKNCGDENVQAHHSDYGNPKKVSWYCKICHHDIHLGV